MQQPCRIAMWSGPRNISTAMMRAWGARADTIVCDEPLYAHYLQATGHTHHPDHQLVIDNQPTDFQEVIDQLTGPLPDGKQIFYQKQMAHHLLPHIPVEWTDQLINVFLIRDPSEMLLSLLKFFPEPTIEETGLPQQLQLFERMQAHRQAVPPVIDSKDVLLDPAGMLESLCRKIDVPFDPGMLTWETGIHETDGIWASHWYKNVAKSTTFGPYRAKTGEFPAKLKPLLEQCQPIYDTLAAHKLQPV